jgi:hypothetical protein
VNLERFFLFKKEISRQSSLKGVESRDFDIISPKIMSNERETDGIEDNLLKERKQ